MFTHWLVKAGILVAACLALGCGDGDNKALNPKLGPNQKPDPRIQRAVEPGKNQDVTQVPGTLP